MSLISSSIVDTIAHELDQAGAGATIRHRLTAPYRKSFLVIHGTVEIFWVVFDEWPHDKKDGYLIIYDEEAEMFGIATKACKLKANVGFLVGFYGTFLEAYRSM